MTDLVTHLTSELIQTLNDNCGKKLKVFAQFIKSDSKVVNAKPLTTAELSDGFFKENFIVFPNIVDNFKQLVHPMDILEVGVVKKDSASNFLLIFDFKVIYSNVRRLVGNPRIYQAGAVNNEGGNSIPDEVIFGGDDDMSANKPQEKGNHRAGAVQNNEMSAQGKKVAYRIESDDEGNDKDHFTEIVNLNHYDRSFKVRGRVIKKNVMKTFKTKDGRDGCVFNIVIKDETRAIQATFFNEVAKKFYDVIDEGKIYSIADAEIRNSSKFNPTDNKFELSISERSEIKRMPEIKEISNFHFKLVKLSEIEHKNEGDTFDVIALVEDPGVIKEMALKSGETKELRKIRIRDDTNFAIDLSFWGQQAIEADFPRNTIVIFQDVRVKQYANSKTLAFSQNSHFITKIPDHPRFKEMLLFKNSSKNTTDNLVVYSDNTATQSNNYVKISQMVAEAEGLQLEGDNSRAYFTVIGTLTRVLGNNVYYEACENENCMKKVTPNIQGGYECEKCRVTFERPKYRLMASIKFTDDSGEFIGMASGDDLAQVIFKKPIEELAEKKARDEKMYSDYIKDCLFGEYKIRVLAKKSIYQQNIRTQFQIIRLTPVMNAPEVYLPCLLSKIGIA
jgi:replication factor A1